MTTPTKITDLHGVPLDAQHWSVDSSEPKSMVACVKCVFHRHGKYCKVVSLEPGKPPNWRIDAAHNNTGIWCGAHGFITPKSPEAIALVLAERMTS